MDTVDEALRQLRQDNPNPVNIALQDLLSRVVEIEEQQGRIAPDDCLELLSQINITISTLMEEIHLLQLMIEPAWGEA